MCKLRVGEDIVELSGKRVIVTGCASGMGAATVRAYVSAGAQVVGMDIADDAGRAVCADAAAYSASKGAVHAWTRTAAGAWGSDGVRVNAVLPAIRTPMFQASWDRATDEERTEKFWRNIHSIALGQEYGDPDRDLGPVMVFLASDASRFITGQLIPVDGGQGNVR